MSDINNEVVNEETVNEEAIEEVVEEVVNEEALEADTNEEAGAEAVNEAGEEASEAKEEDKKSKRKEKKEKKDKKDEKIKELEDRVMRQMAEFENFRRRSEAEKSAMYGLGAKSVIEKILPVLDNLERGLLAIPEDQKDTPVAQGMQMIYKQFSTELESLGVKPIEAVGTEFDANLHNAVMQVESDKYESGFVAQELQKGYMYRESVVRHSMVAVVQ